MEMLNNIDFSTIMSRRTLMAALARHSSTKDEDQYWEEFEGWYYSVRAITSSVTICWLPEPEIPLLTGIRLDNLNRLKKVSTAVCCYLPELGCPAAARNDHTLKNPAQPTGTRSFFYNYYREET